MDWPGCRGSKDDEGMDGKTEKKKKAGAIKRRGKEQKGKMEGMARETKEI